jgi:hypothetical protein
MTFLSARASVVAVRCRVEVAATAGGAPAAQAEPAFFLFPFRRCGSTATKNPNYTWFMYHGRRFTEANGIIVNMVAELEQSTLAAIADGRYTPTPVPRRSIRLAR